MYRQIWVAANHCGYQRIVWREDETTPIKHYELSTVTYGKSWAPFLAVRVLDQLAHDHQHDFPTAAKILKEQFYVDDVLTGAHTEEELIRNQNELIQLIKCAGMELGKWVSNSSCVVDRSLATRQRIQLYSKGSWHSLGSRRGYVILQSLPYNKSAQHQTPSAVRCCTHFWPAGYSVASGSAV